eukprot:TRINITY_DN1885_c0_g1_i3.p2 TRINITY_DN1885_c0_g1~~TRINITY_DN1885_c0_g1_i3.p2  ORF type:complete len:240 (+),score=28.23 TRINITY_DN1885_c0_g1_i3:34-720(+)
MDLCPKGLQANTPVISQDFTQRSSAALSCTSASSQTLRKCRLRLFRRHEVSSYIWDRRQLHRHDPCRSINAGIDIPDFLPAGWKKQDNRSHFGPSLEFSAEDAVEAQLSALKTNDVPYADHGIEVMYRFAGFDPFERSRYFGRQFDLGQFERFRRIFHHSTYRAFLGHTESRVLSTFFINERVWVRGVRPGEEETFEFTLVQRVGGSWDGIWFTESVVHDGDGLSKGI